MFISQPKLLTTSLLRAGFDLGNLKAKTYNKIISTCPDSKHLPHISLFTLMIVTEIEHAKLFWKSFNLDVAENENDFTFSILHFFSQMHITEKEKNVILNSFSNMSCIFSNLNSPTDQSVDELFIEQADKICHGCGVTGKACLQISNMDLEDTAEIFSGLLRNKAAEVVQMLSGRR